MGHSGVMTEPVAFYKQIHHLNEGILGALGGPDLDVALALLEERSNWMRAENCPTVEEEHLVRDVVVPLMEAILVQDAAIEAALRTRQKLISEALQSTQRTRVANEYRSAEGMPDAKFVDREG